MKKIFKPLLLATFLFGHCICYQTSILTIRSKINNEKNGNDMGLLYENNGHSYHTAIHSDIAFITNDTFNDSFSNILLPIIEKISQILPKNESMIKEIEEYVKVKIDQTINLNLKFRQKNSMSDFKDHVSHHIGKPKDDTNENFIIKVNDLKTEDKENCIAALRNRGITEENALETYVFNANVIANDFDTNSHVNRDNYWNLYEKELRTRYDSDFKDLIPVLILNRCIYQSYHSKDAGITLYKYDINQKNKGEKITTELAQKEVSENKPILISLELHDLYGEFTTLVCFRYNPTNQELIFTTFYPKKFNAEDVRQSCIHYNVNFNTAFKDQNSDPDYLKKCILYYINMNVGAFNCIFDNEFICDRLKDTYEYMKKDYDQKCEAELKKRFDNKNKKSKKANGKNKSNDNKANNDNKEINYRCIDKEKKELFDKIKERKQSLAQDGRFSKKLLDEIYKKLDNIKENNDIVNLVFLYSFLNVCNDIHGNILYRDKILDFINKKVFSNKNTINEETFDILLYVILNDENSTYLVIDSIVGPSQKNILKDLFYMLYTSQGGKPHITKNLDTRNFEKKLKTLHNKMGKVCAMCDHFLSMKKSIVTGKNGENDMIEIDHKNINVFANTLNKFITKQGIPVEKFKVHEDGLYSQKEIVQLEKIFSNTIRYIHNKICTILYDYYAMLDLYKTDMKLSKSINERAVYELFEPVLKELFPKCQEMQVPRIPEFYIELPKTTKN